MKIKEKKGMVFVAALGVVLVFTLVTSSSMIVSVSETQMSKGQNSSVKAFYLAESGVEFGKYDLKSDFSAYENMEY